MRWLDGTTDSKDRNLTGEPAAPAAAVPTPEEPAAPAGKRTQNSQGNRLLEGTAKPCEHQDPEKKEQ